MRVLKNKFVPIIITLVILFVILSILSKNRKEKLERITEIQAVQKSEAYLDDTYQFNWSLEMVHSFEQTLGLDDGFHNEKDSCPFAKHIVSALSYSDQCLESYIWSYFSLYSLRKIEYLFPAIPEKMQAQLSMLFDKIVLPLTREIPRRCYTLKNSVILGYYDEIPNLESMTTPFLIEENGMRYKDVVKITQKNFKEHFR